MEASRCAYKRNIIFLSFKSQDAMHTLDYELCIASCDLNDKNTPEDDYL